MLAKGHHLPGLTLAVICEADQALFSHDYRAPEHLGQLITQVAGRTGREKKQGELLVETAYPDHPLWGKLVDNTYGNFAKGLIEDRLAQRLPPLTHSAVLRAECPDLAQLIDFVEIAKTACASNTAEIDIVGPMPAVQERRKGRYRYQINFFCPKRKPLHQMLSTLSDSLTGLKKMSQVRWVIDVDPQTLD